MAGTECRGEHMLCGDNLQPTHVNLSSGGCRGPLAHHTCVNEGVLEVGIACQKLFFEEGRIFDVSVHGHIEGQARRHMSQINLFDHVAEGSSREDGRKWSSSEVDASSQWQIEKAATLNIRAEKSWQLPRCLTSALYMAFPHTIQSDLTQ